MEHGSRVNAARAERALVTAGVPVPGESVAFTSTCFNFVPNVDLIVATTERLLGMVAGSGQINYEVKLGAIGRVSSSGQQGHLCVQADGSNSVTFKKVPVVDLHRLTDFLEGRQGGADDSLGRAVSLFPTEGAGTAISSGNSVKPYYGRRTLTTSFAGRSIEIYQNGYIRIAPLWIRDSTPFERLHSIEARAEVTKKSGFGRGAAAAMTMGVSLVGPNRRGEVYLTIATDNDVHVLTSSPTDAALRGSQRLEAAGKAAIQAAAASASSAAQREGSHLEHRAPTATERLAQLAELLEACAITEDEFQEHRERILKEV